MTRKIQLGLPLLFMLMSFYAKAQDTTITASGIKYIVIKEGKNNTHPQPGDEVKVHYEGRFKNGNVFDTSKGVGVFSFTVGKKEVIPGWEEAIQLMSEKEEAVFHIPSQLAYGSKGVKDPYNSAEWMIPPNEDLIFTIKLLKIKTP